MKCEFIEGLSSFLCSMIFCFVLIMPAAIVGCAEKETVLDVETPNGEVEVQRDVETGETEVDVTRDAPGADEQPATPVGPAP